MGRVRLKIGEWLHILADKVLPIPAWANGGKFVFASDGISQVEAARIVEGSDIYTRSKLQGIDMSDAKELVIAEARNEVLADIAREALPMIEYSVVAHGTRNRLYYEVRGRLRIAPTRSQKHSPVSLK